MISFCLEVVSEAAGALADVEFDHYLTDGEVFLQLVSPGAKEISDEWRDTAIDRVLNEIRGIAPDIAILEA